MAAEESLQPERNEVNEDWGKESGVLGMTKLLHAGTYSEAAARETTVTVCLAVIK